MRAHTPTSRIYLPRGPIHAGGSSTSVQARLVRNVFMRGPRVWTHFRYRFPAISEMTIRPPRPTKRVHAGQRERERERTANLSLAALGILRGEEEGEGEKERERGASF